MTHRGSAMQVLGLPEDRVQYRLTLARESQQKVEIGGGFPLPLPSLPAQPGAPTCRTSSQPVGPGVQETACWVLAPATFGTTSTKRWGWGWSKSEQRTNTSGVSVQQSPTFSAPGTSFVEDNVSMGQGGAGEDGFGFTSHMHILLCGPGPNGPWTRTSWWPKVKASTCSVSGERWSSYWILPQWKGWESSLGSLWSGHNPNHKGSTLVT